MSKTPFLDALRSLESQHEEASLKIDALLRKQSWEYTSDTVGNYWMWQKKIKGVLYSVNKETAIRIEENICGEHYEESDFD